MPARKPFTVREWRYNQQLEGTQVKINLCQNGKLLRTIAENVTIGKNGSGSWQGAWDRFFPDSPPMQKGAINKDYQIEIISLTDSKLRVIGDNADWDWGN